MKKGLATLLSILGISFIMIGANFKTQPEQSVTVKKHCSGYTILEAGVGIDCYGDTVKLVKMHGYYELAVRYENNNDITN